jgi:SP family general alpha glucoside:H+ symporter-like MFS transporter
VSGAFHQDVNKAGLTALFEHKQSPWWLVRKGRIEEAKKTLRWMVSAKDTDYDVDRNVAMMIHTNAHEKAVSAETSYKSLFTGVDLRRTEITCGVWLIQVTCGTWFGRLILHSAPHVEW